MIQRRNFHVRHVDLLNKYPYDPAKKSSKIVLYPLNSRYDKSDGSSSVRPTPVCRFDRRTLSPRAPTFLAGDLLLYYQLKAAQAGFFVLASRCVSSSAVWESTDDVLSRMAEDVKVTKKAAAHTYKYQFPYSGMS